MLLIYKDPLLRGQILRTALPAMTEMILYMLIGVVDVAVVGRLGAAPLAAVSIGAEIFFAVILFVESLAVGSTILVAQAKGAGQWDIASKVAGITVILGIVLGTLVSWLGMSYSPQILSVFKTEARVYDEALKYLSIVFPVSIFALTYYMINSIFRGLGRTDIPMKIALVVNIINSVGDYVLVFGKCGLPALGSPGAAVATAIAHVIGFVLAAGYLLSGKCGLKTSISSLPYFQWNLFKSIIRLGLPALGEQFFNTISSLTSMFLIVYLGTLAFASHQVALTVESLSFMPGFGIAIAATALVGQAVGAKNLSEVQRASRGCLELVSILMGALGLLFALIPVPIASLFTNDKDIIAIAAVLIRIAALEQITIAISMAIAGILKGTGDTRTPMLISTSLVMLFRLPVMYLLIRVYSAPIEYIWGLFVTDWLIRVSIYLIVYRRKNWLKHAMQDWKQTASPES